MSAHTWDLLSTALDWSSLALLVVLSALAVVGLVRAP